MSTTSRPNNAEGQLVVEGPHWAAEVRVYDHTFKQVAQGVGKLEQLLLPGIYEVETILPGNSERQLIVVRAGNTATVTYDSWKVKFYSAMPLRGTANALEWHCQAAEEWSKKITWRAQQDGPSRLFIFIRTLEPEKYPRLAQELYLVDSAGQELTHVAEGCATDLQQGWLAFTVDLPSGLYLLGAKRARQEVHYQPLWLSPNYETQVFLQAGGPPHLHNLSVSMAQRGVGFKAGDEEIIASELILDGLQRGRNLATSEQMNRLLQGEFKSPWLGILAAHALREGRPDEGLLAVVLENLQSRLQLRDHPDVRALTLRESSPAESFFVPPMLWASLKIIQRHATRHTETIPLNSLTDHISDRLLVEGPWVAWQNMDNAELCSLLAASPDDHPMFRFQSGVVAEVGMPISLRVVPNHLLVRLAQSLPDNPQQKTIFLSDFASSLKDLPAEELSQACGLSLARVQAALYRLQETPAWLAFPERLSPSMQAVVSHAMKRSWQTGAWSASTMIGEEVGEQVYTILQQAVASLSRLARMTDKLIPKTPVSAFLSRTLLWVLIRKYPKVLPSAIVAGLVTSAGMQWVKRRPEYKALLTELRQQVGDGLKNLAAQASEWLQWLADRVVKLDNAIIITDEAGKLKYANVAFARFMGEKTMDRMAEESELFHQVLKTLREAKLGRSILDLMPQPERMIRVTLVRAEVRESPSSNQVLACLYNFCTYKQPLVSKEFLTTFRKESSELLLYLSLLEHGTPERRQDYLKALKEELNQIRRQAKLLPKSISTFPAIQAAVNCGGAVMKIALRLFGSFLMLLVVAALLLAWLNSPKPGDFHGGLQNPVIALELVRTTAHVNQVKEYYGEANWQRELKRSLRIDAAVFIPFYGALLLIFSLLLLCHRFHRAAWLGGLAVLGTLAAIVFDYRENYFINQVLQHWPDGVTADLLPSLWHASVVKWTAVFVTIGLLAALFLWRRHWTLVIGLLYLASVLLGLTGVGQYLWQSSNYAFLEYAFLPLLAALWLTGLFFAFAPQRFLEGILDGTNGGATVGVASPIPFARVLLEEYALHQKTHGVTEMFRPKDLKNIEEQFAEIEQKYAAIKDEATRAICSKAEKDRLNQELVKDFYRRMHQLAGRGEKRAALCFSGGGIRSATFVLGLMQGLTRRVDLGNFHYLSTVSGGGYLGSWLSAWAHRQGLAEVQGGLRWGAPPPQGPLPAEAPPNPLASEPNAEQDPLDPEPEPIQHLRRYSNHMTPRLGLFSADTWALVGIYLRNLSLNWLVLLPLLMVFLSVPRLAMAFTCWNQPLDWVLGLLSPVGLLLGMWAISYFVANRPSLNKQGTHAAAEQRRLKLRNDEVGFLWFCLLPLSLVGALCTAFWAWLYIKPNYQQGAEILLLTRPALWVVLVTAALVWVLLRVLKRHWERRQRTWANLICGLIGVLCVGGLLLARSGKLPAHYLALDSRRPLLFILFATALYLGGVCLSWLLTGRWDRREFVLSILPVGLIGGLCLWGSAALFPKPVNIEAARTQIALAKPAQSDAASDKILVKPTGEKLTMALATDQTTKQTSLRVEAPVTTETQPQVASERLLLNEQINVIQRTGWYVCFAVPLFLLAFLAAATIFVGLASGITTDADREWMARAGAWMLMAIGGWIAVSVVVLFGPIVVVWLGGKLVASVTTVSGLTTLIFGWLPKTAATVQGESGSKGKAGQLLKWGLSLMAVIFALSFFALLSLATSELLRGFAQSDLVQGIYRNFLPDRAAPLTQLLSGTDKSATTTDWHWLVLHEVSGPVVLCVVGLLLLLGGVLGFFVNVNKFSLHAAYRDRLIRSYLGASNPQRRPNPFTGFDTRDDLQMHELLLPLFEPNCFKDFAAFRALLIEQDGAGDQTETQDRVAGFIWRELTPVTRERLKGGGWHTEAQLKELLAAELNRIIHGELMYTPKLWPRTWLRKQMAKILFLRHPGELVFKGCEQHTESYQKIAAIYARQPDVPVFPGKWLPSKFVITKKVPVERVLLNRLLIEAAFPDLLEQLPVKLDQPCVIEEPRPLHVLNMALNLVRGKELAWQERKAESFTVSPLHCGSQQLGYRPAREYAVTLGGQSAITLGTALAISGAAANPNCGYNSSPLITFFLALFNVRLGWWLGNPGVAGQATYRISSPGFAPNALLAETFGFTDDEHRYVNVSDGGHFDNLALYEMVRRRCHFVVVSDAGWDSQYVFDDLGIAIRRIRADMGVPIEIHPIPIGPEKDKYCAVGQINYKAVDGKDAVNGVLLYVKPVCYGGEPADVYNYYKSNPAFPHDPTMTDQMFSESQFESYRHLGEHIIEEVTMKEKGRLDLARLEAKVSEYLRRAAQAEMLKPAVEALTPARSN